MLTPLQEGMLFHYLKDPASHHYCEHLCLEISGEIEFTFFEQAWNFVIETNEMLRTVFRWQKVENPIQIVLKEHKLQVRYYDISGIDAGMKGKYLEELKEKARKEPFDLLEVPFRVTLFKIDRCKYEMTISNHHILYDGWSTGIILEEFLTAYSDLFDKRITIRPVKAKFKEFVQKTRNENKKNKERKSWKNYLEGVDNPREISIKKRTVEVNATGSSGNYRISFAAGTRAELKRFVKTTRITVAALLYCAWGILLQRYNNSDDVIFGTAVSGRNVQSVPITGIEDMVGLFINTLPLRIHNRSREKAGDFLSRVHRELQQREEYEMSSLVDIKQYCDINADVELFDTVMVIENYPLDSRLKQKNTRLSIDSYSMFERTHYDLTISVTFADDIMIGFLFRKDRFDEETIELLSQHYISVIENIIKNPRQEITRIEILSSDEKKRLLVDFNTTDADYPLDKTIHQLFERQCAQIPDSIAIIGRAPGKMSGESCQGVSLSTGFDNVYLTYSKVKEKAHQAACLFREAGVKPDDIVGIMLECSIETVTGILGILIAGGAYLPIDPGYPAERFRYILADSGTRVLAAAKTYANRVKGVKNIFLDEGDIKGHDCSSNLESSGLAINSDSLITANPANLAYVIYTSGSTGQPKGVTVRHDSVVNLLWHMDRLYSFTAAAVFLFKTSFVFDVSVSELFGWFLCGGRLVIPISGKNEQKDPQILVNTINRFGITHINFVPSQFNVFLDQLDRENIDRISSLKYIFLAGETLLPEPVRTFKQLNANLQLENLYGPTEATVYASRYSLDQWQGAGAIPIGKPLANVKLFILDKFDRLQPIAVPGELSIAGKGLARGYLNNQGLTLEKFVNYKIQNTRPLSIKKGTGKKTCFYIYRTGDLARWLIDGNIEFLGRIDFQVKIRGFRIELGEIENQLLKRDEIKEAIVTALSDETGDHFLCAYIVPLSPGTMAVSQWRDYLLTRLPAYMVPVHFVELKERPLTGTGKIDRKALPTPGIVSLNHYAAPRTRTESLLVDIWSELLPTVKKPIGIDDNFFRLGGHSLKATRMAGRLQKVFDLNITLKEIFAYPAIRKLARHIDGAAQKNKLSCPESIEEKEYYELSSVQERLYVLHQVEEGATAYNMTGIFDLEGSIDKVNLENTFTELIRQHDSLRTSFLLVNEEPVQRIHKHVDFKIIYFDSGNIHHANSGLDLQKINRITGNFIRAFDLSRGPLLRVGLIKVEYQRFMLIVDMHHIIADGISHLIMIRDFVDLYAGKTLPRLRVRYKDFARWQNIFFQSGEIKKQERYWLKLFKGEIPLLNLPLDKTRPPVQSFEGSTLHFEMNREETGKLKEIALENNATLFMVLLSVFNVFLYALTGREDIVVGTPVSGRRHPDSENIMGMFVNTLALRNQPRMEKKFDRFLENVRETTLQALANQDYPFEKLVEQVVEERDSSRNPLFDVMLVLEEPGELEFSLPGLKITPGLKKNNASKFDLTLTGAEIDGELHFTFSFNTNLLDKATIERFAKYFKNTVSSVMADHNRKLSEIEIILAEEKKQVLFDFNFNRTDGEYPVEKSIFEHFTGQVNKTPDKMCVVGTSLYQSPGTMKEFLENENYLSYCEILLIANQLAYSIRSKEVRPDDVVGVLLSPTVEILLSILAVMSAGCAYLPIDRETPGERVKFMLNDCCAAATITTKALAREFDLKGDVILIDDCLGSGETRRENSLPSCSSSFATVPIDSLAYVIYTSGTTGRPKGVLLTQRNLVNYINWFIETTQLTSIDNALLTSSFAFDLGYTSLFPPLLSGGGLHIIPREIYLEAGQLINYAESHRITYLKMTPSLFSAFFTVPGCSARMFRYLRLVVLGGEPIIVRDLDRARQLFPHVKCINHYGPTETTIGCIAQYIPLDIDKFQQYKETPTIGKPITNTQVYIVAKGRKLQPPGIPGELCISGAGLARGYLNQPELTVEKFEYVCLNISEGSFPFLEMIPRNRRSRSRMYRTGDLAQWLPDGTIKFLGRIDLQVKVRGYRIELGEIENQLLMHHHIKEAVVKARQNQEGNKCLCAYIVIGNALLMTRLREYLSRRLPEYMVPSRFVALEQIPLTPNGKVDEKALFKFDTGEKPGDNRSPGNDLERKLVEIWAQVLDNSKDIIGLDTNFFQLNGNSLKATKMIAKIHKEFNVNVPLTEILKSPTIRALSRYIEDADKKKYKSIEPAEKKSFYQLSYNQKRLFFIHQLEPASMAYHMPSFLELNHKVEEEILQKALQMTAQCHESLRTYFKVLEGEPVQVVVKEVEIPFKSIDISFMEEKNKQKERSRIFNEQAEIPFDLTRVPIFRTTLVKLEECHFQLMFNMHHIISDGWSMEILKRDFLGFYEGYRIRQTVDIEPQMLHYKDFAAWHNKQLSLPEIRDRAHGFWKEKLNNGVGELQLPGVFGGNREDNKGAGYRYVISRETKRKLKQLARNIDSTLFMVMFSIYLVLLSRLSGQKEVTCSIISAGRKHPALDHMVGFFVNSVLFRTRVNHDEGFEDFLQRVKGEVLETFHHENYPLELVLKDLKMKHPEIPVSFNMLNLSTACADRELESAAPCHIPETIDVKFDMEAYVLEYKNGIRMTWNYKKSLFKPSFIEYMVSEYVRLTNFFLTNSREPLAAYGQQEKKRHFSRKRKT